MSQAKVGWPDTRCHLYGRAKHAGLRIGFVLHLDCDEMGAGGLILGDLPPYEAFPIGGTNSVRGYSEGGVGSGRNYIAGTTALQWPMFGPVEVITHYQTRQDWHRLREQEYDTSI